MKEWMKVLVWIGLGLGIGGFGGVQIGRRMERKAMTEEKDETFDGQFSQENVDRVIANYRGEDTDGDTSVDLPKETEEWYDMEVKPSEPREEKSVMDYSLEHLFSGAVSQISELKKSFEKINIPSLHPEDMTGEPITEEEFNRNDYGFDIRDLVFYGMDEKVYDETKDEVIERPEQLLGVGWDVGMGDPRNPVQIAYFQNKMLGEIYRVDYVDAAYCDVYSGAHPEEYDDDDDEVDPSLESAWRDVDTDDEGEDN